MGANQPIVISGVGMPSSVGHTAAQTFASVLAKITRMSELPEVYSCYPENQDFEEPTPLVAASIPYLEDFRATKPHASEWLAYIAAKTYLDLASEMALTQKNLDDCGFYFSLSPQRAGWSPALEDEFLYHFQNFAGLDISHDVRFMYCGHVGGISLIDAASTAVSQGELKYAVVGGVESYLFPEWLEPLDKEYRIKSDRNIDGFVPGECAAFILLEPEDRAKKRGRHTLSPVHKIAKQQCSGSDLELRTGMALTKTISSLLDACHEPPLVVCDLNGEPGRMKEWGFAVSRLNTRLGKPVLLEHPAVILGDIGAASGVALTILATFFLKTKYQSQSSALVWCASDNGERAGLLVGRQITT